MKQDAGQSTRKHREERLLQVLEEITRRRGDGETVLDRHILDEHSDLQPELEQSLADLQRIEAAESNAVASAMPGADELDDGDPADSDAYPALPSVPGYAVMNEIHRGGQGVVYRAVHETTERQVAIKVLHDQCLVSKQGRDRFNQEVQILGRLRHPNLVTIHDSGMYNGRFYLVMDFISGIPPDSYCFVHKLAIDQRLRLFMRICNAVNAAHLHGVIHRDLKPSNIHVDERGEPHVLDFGLAKLIPQNDAGPPSNNPMTETGQFLGSLPWASPEQALGNSRTVDLRTDIYSLGLIANKMLTGRFPYTVEGDTREVLTNIIDIEPQSLRAQRPDIADDVDAIVRKCLCKEPGGRYQSAGAIAEDLGRYFDKLPILARAPSTLYQLKKLTARHKLPFALFATLITLLFSTVVLMTHYWRRDAALIKRVQLAEQRASAEADSANAVNEFLVNDLLAGVRPEIARGYNPTVRDALDTAAQRIEHAFPQQPLVEASVRAAMGQSYASLGLYVEAEPHIRKAVELRSTVLGLEHPDTLSAELGLATLLGSQGRYHEADALTATILKTTQLTLGDEHELTLEALHERAMLQLYLGNLQESEQLLMDLLNTRTRLFGDDHPSTLGARANWTYIALVRNKRQVEAENSYRTILDECIKAFGEDHPQTLRAMLNVAQTLSAQRKLPEAGAMFRKTLAEYQRILGDDHPETLVLKVRFARLRQGQGRLTEAISLLHEASAAGERVLGREHPITLQALETLGHNLGLKGDFTKAEAIHRETLDRHRRIYGDHHTSTAHSLDCLGMVLSWMGRHGEAERCFRESCAIFRLKIGSSEPLVSPLRGLVRTLDALGRSSEARPLGREVLRLRQAAAEDPATDAYRLNCYARALLMVHPPDLRDPAEALKYALRAFEVSSDAYHYNRYILGLAYEAEHNVGQAIAMLRLALAHIPNENSQERRWYEAALVRILEDAGDNAAATAVYGGTLRRRRNVPASEPIEIAESLARLGETHLRHGDHIIAEELLRECVWLREENLPEGDWRIGEAMSMLGAALGDQGRSVEAKILLTSGSEILDLTAMAKSDQAAAARSRLHRLVTRDDKAASEEPEERGASGIRDPSG